MSVETEIKLRLADPGDFRRRLADLGADLVVPRHFEDNLVLDSPARDIAARGSVVRLRHARGASVLTYKGPARPEGPFKSREEFETAVADGEAALEILGGIGLRPCFRYQKFREEYRVELPGLGRGAVRVAVDETPAGTYAELEGSEEPIRRLAAALGYSEADFLRESYYTLHARRRPNGEPLDDMVFPDADRGE